MTSGLSAKSGCSRVSSTISGALAATAWPQNEMSRGVSWLPSPVHDLNHWRRSSTSETSANGTLNRSRARSVRLSNPSSAGVSSSASECRAASRSASSSGYSGGRMGSPVDSPGRPRRARAAGRRIMRRHQIYRQFTVILYAPDALRSALDRTGGHADNFYPRSASRSARVGSAA